MKIKPKVLDIFCGAGGLSLGFQNAGCIILGGIDKNPYAINTHHKNFPNSILKLPAQNICNIQNLDDLKLEQIHILIGSPPCQSFSRIGISKMKSLNKDINLDDRNFLYKEMIRFLKHYKPFCFAMENVDNLVNNHEIFPQICRDFIDNGYVIEYKILDASKFEIPQRRKRLFIIGTRYDLNISPYFLDNTYQKTISIKDAISDLPNLTPPKIKNEKYQDLELKYKSTPQSSYQEKMRKNNQYVKNHICHYHNERDLLIFNSLPQGGISKDIPIELLPNKTNIFERRYRRFIWDEPAWTITAHLKKDTLAFIHPIENRGISVREAARLQSFPDDFIFYAPKSRMYELIGNAVPPLLAEIVAKSLVEIVQKVLSN